jgi:chromosome segregation ATPase
MPKYQYLDNPSQLQYCAPSLEIKEIIYEDVIDEFTTPQNINGTTTYVNQRSIVRKPRIILQEDPAYTEQLAQEELKNLKAQYEKLKKLAEESETNFRQANQNIAALTVTNSALRSQVESIQASQEGITKTYQLQLIEEQNKTKDYQKALQNIEKVKRAIGEIEWNHIVGNSQELPEPGERHLEL